MQFQLQILVSELLKMSECIYQYYTDLDIYI